MTYKASPSSKKGTASKAVAGTKKVVKNPPSKPMQTLPKVRNSKS